MGPRSFDLISFGRDGGRAMRIAIIGTGYVGLTTGAALAYLGHEVTCIDIDREKIELLQKGRIPFFEPHIDDLVAACGDRLEFSTEYGAVAEAQVSFITVGTPPRPDGRTDLRSVDSAALSIGRALKPDQRHVIINKSTVPIGSGDYVSSLVLRGLREAHGDPRLQGAFQVASNPEFLREGSAVADSLYPDRVVVGAEDPSTLVLLQELYEPIVEQSFPPPTFLPRPDALGCIPFVTTDVISAETIKYAANAFLATKISFINQLAGLCERVGADVTEIAHGIGLDERIGPKFLRAGIGWGGSCFGKDIKALIHSGLEYNYPMPLLEATIEVNRRQIFTVIEKLQDELKVLKGKSVGVLGLAFKPDTDDLRDAPSLEIIRWLLERGAHVAVHDPVAMSAFRRSFPDLAVRYADSPHEASFEADALVLVTEWRDYQDLDWASIGGAMRGRLVIDGRNVLNREVLDAQGFRYCGIGR